MHRGGVIRLDLRRRRPGRLHVLAAHPRLALPLLVRTAPDGTPRVTCPELPHLQLREQILTSALARAEVPEPNQREPLGRWWGMKPRVEGKPLLHPHFV